MNAATLDTYMNIFLFVAIFGGVAYGLYRVLRTKKPQVRELPKRPGEHKPRVKQEETDGYPEEWVGGSPITDWREMPTRSPMHTAVAKPPTFKQVISKKPKVVSHRTTAPHSPYRRDDVDVTIPENEREERDTSDRDSSTNTDD